MPAHPGRPLVVECQKRDRSHHTPIAITHVYRYTKYSLSYISLLGILAKLRKYTISIFAGIKWEGVQCIVSLSRPGADSSVSVFTLVCYLPKEEMKVITSHITRILSTSFYHLDLLAKLGIKALPESRND